MLSMHERRKSVSSASVIWYTILFRQNRTDRPILLHLKADENWNEGKELENVKTIITLGEGEKRSLHGAE